MTETEALLLAASICYSSKKVVSIKGAVNCANELLSEIKQQSRQEIEDEIASDIN